MSALLLFGASRGTGAEIIDLALRQKFTCTIVVRRQECADQLAQQGATVFIGDANDADTVLQACAHAGKDCTIICTLGGAQANYHAQVNIINQAEKVGIKRMVLITSLGCGNSWPTLSARAKSAFGFSVREKTLAESWLQTSSLDYAILRPGGLTNGEPTHNGHLYLQQSDPQQLYPQQSNSGQEVHGFIRRSDLALLVMQKVSQVNLKRNVYAVVDPDLVVQRDNKKSE